MDAGDAATSREPVLVYLYGPPASGKLTISQRLSELTGFPLFHNHLAVDAVRPIFDFGSPAFVGVVHRLRLDIIRTAMQTGTSLIFTNNSAWGGDDARARFVSFAADALATAESSGGRVQWVRVTAPTDVLLARLAGASRHAHGKLTDPGRLLELLDGLDLSPLHPDDLTVDTGVTSPDDAARIVAAALRAAQLGPASPRLTAPRLDPATS